MDEENKQPDAPAEQPAQMPSEPVAPAPAQPQPQVVQQYVVTEKSLQGVSGWLLFWVIIFVLSGIGSLSAFASLLSGISSASASMVVSLIFLPIMAIGWLASAVLIILQRKLAVLVTLISFGIVALDGVISTIINYTSGGSNDTPATFIVGILIGLILTALFASYFVVSKRVKQTLIK